jgi:adenylate kinase
LVRRILHRAEVEGRADDNPQTVANRLQVFNDATAPLIDYYRGRGILHVIDADRDADEVTEAIIGILQTAA